MARKQNKIEIAATHAREAAQALAAAQEAVEAARKVYTRANTEWLRLTAQRKARQPRHEYAVVLIDEHGDGNNSLFHATLAEARVDAKRYVGESEGDTTIVGTVIERVRLSDLERTTVEAYGRVSAAWFDGDAAGCDGCDGTFPSSEVEVMGDAERGSFGFCRSCRAKDAKAAQG